MKQWFIKKLFNLAGGMDGLLEMIGGVDTLLELLINWLNDNLLAKIKDPLEFAAYATDLEEFANLLEGMFTRHEKWMSEAKREALKATIAAVRELATALKDCKVEKAEIDGFVDKVIAAVKAWRAAK